ncbi:MAG TPA: hypothetical protein VM422_12010, partial [Amaricoccus sp.]|nr:hypothetical protein [Amaricoccus sp.]
ALEGNAPLAPLPSLAAEPRAIYLAPGGRDDWSGRRPAPEIADGPVATLERARDLARADPGIDSIVLRGGDYWLTAPARPSSSGPRARRRSGRCRRPEEAPRAPRAGQP